jgi:DNA-binding transcriptional ArsR family regulator
MLVTMSEKRFTQPCNVDCGPAVAGVAAAIADVTRSRMLWALLDGRGLSAGELAMVAATSAQNASNHLRALLGERLVRVHLQGRHRYYSLANALVAQAIESLLIIAKPTFEASPSRDSARLQPWRFARSCYDHLAGRLAIELNRGLIEQGVLIAANGGYELGPRGQDWLRQIGIDAEGVRTQRRAFARECMDWTERRPHLGGALGAALLQRMLALDWLRRTKVARQLTVSIEGERHIRRLFGIDPAAVRATTLR